ncbi:MAG: thiolase family protein [Thermodesulfobacteriota bacterium]
MARRVGICAVAQTNYERDIWYERFQGMALEVVESLQAQTGLGFTRHEPGEGIDMAISVSDDVFDARTISDNAMTDVLGAHFGCEEKVAQEGIQAVYYALAAVAAGHHDVVLVLGHCKESQSKSRNMVTHVAFDPFFTRPLGMDFCAAAGMQARAYGEKSGIGDDELAKVVVRARENASKNPHTAGLESLTAADVTASEMLADPIRNLHAYPVSDGAVGMIIAAEDVAKKITDKPVWINGVGNCMDTFFPGDRDLAANFSLKKAAEKAYKRAGITDPKTAFDVIEVSDQYAYQLPMWIEGLGLCDEGRGSAWIDGNGPEKMNVNASGGMLSGNPMILGGLVRAAEAAVQLRGEGGKRQVGEAKTALAHGVMGPAGQFHSVVILERD